MSETQRKLLNRRAGYLLVAGALLLLLIVVVVRVLSPSPREPVAVDTLPEHKSVPLTSPVVFDTEAFYQTIIDNNLFRPLGWTPPRPIEPYRLIGTLLPRGANTPPQAIIQTTTGEQTYIVSLGEKIDASTEVVSIEGKQVTLLSNGQQRTLLLNTAVYLNPSRATRSPRQTTHTPRQRPAPVRSQPTPAPPAVSAPQPPDRPAPLSEWETRDGQPIPIGDARLKNPQKWGLRRR